MSAYWRNHPETSPEDIKDLFCGEESMDEAYINIGIPQKAKMCFIILALLIIICIALFFISGSWDAPTITTN